MKKSRWMGMAATLVMSATLAGCGDQKQVEFGGTPAMYGNNPMGPAPGAQNFAPKIFTVVYMKLVQAATGPTFKAQHAYFAQPATGQPDVLGAVTRFRTNRWSGGTGPLPIDGKVRNDFQNFGFSQQSQIYVVFDDANVSIVGQRPLYFTQYGANDPTLQKKLDDNESFYNAKVVSFGDPIQAIYMEDWFRDANGKPIPADPEKPAASAAKPRPQIAKYSINFNYRLASAVTPGVSIPFAVDPDVGNGYDDPPP